MTDDPSAELRELAHTLGHALISKAPWDEVAERVTLLLTAPPTGIDAAPGSVSMWLSLDTATARTLPQQFHAIVTDEAMIERQRAVGETPAVTITFTTDTAVDRLLESQTRRAMEARWQVRHSEVITDRLHRAENYALRAGMLPDDAPERVVRGLWVEANAAARAFPSLAARAADALPAAGELIAALCRLACFVDDGAYPSAEWLLPAARPTRIGKRIGNWLDDILPALAGDPDVARRVISSTDQVIAEVQEVLAERYRGHPWLVSPEVFTLRTPR